MALGGGYFATPNKILPGSYINFISLKSATSELSERGVAAMPLELDWGIDGEVFKVTGEEFRKNSIKIFGYGYEHEKLKGLRDLFRNIKTLYAYKLNAGVKATNIFGTAKSGGIRGNDLKVSIQKNIDNPNKFDVRLLLGIGEVDAQTVTSAAELQDNDFIVWKKDVTLSATATTSLDGGTNGDAIDTEDYQTFLNKIESYSFNTLGVVTETATVKDLVAAFTRQMREEQGIKFQSVCYQTAADSEGIVNVKNTVLDDNCSAASLVYWVTGIIAGCEVNKSNLNKKYNGEFTITTGGTQSQLELAIKNGEFTLHKVGDDIRVLADINSLVTITDNKEDIFKENQTIRVIDQIANDIAVLFNTKYLGVIPNDASGRISLWSDIVKHHMQLQDIRAIEEFSDNDVVVTEGATKRSVVVSDVVTVVNAMAQIYMTCVVA